MINDTIIPAYQQYGEHFSTSIYIHIPFCTSRCSYCDFFSTTHAEKWIPAYINALIAEIENTANRAEEPLKIHSIYFGGGTPSLLKPHQIEMILHTIKNRFYLTKDAEITLEANPTSLNHIHEIQRYGINRISLGVQSIHNHELEILKRSHRFEDANRVIHQLQQENFPNINLDLIYGIPTQTLKNWEETLNSIVTLKPEHISLYSLTLEEYTSLYLSLQRGDLPPIDNDLAADMYELAENVLTKNGFEQYEISNWAKKSENGMSYQCIHNTQYWLNYPYLGFGAAAHGYYQQYRWRNHEQLQAYIQRCFNISCPHPFPISPAAEEIIPLSIDELMDETMFMGLRLTQRGIREADFKQRFAVDLMDIFGKQIKDLCSQKLLEEYENPSKGYRLTKRGKLLANQVFMQFLRC